MEEKILRIPKVLKAEHKEIFEYWNSKKIIVNQEPRKGFERKLAKQLKEYTIDEIKLGIDHYATMYYDPDYIYCNYKWTLNRLLQIENGIAEFMDDGPKWINYCRFKEERKTKPKPKPEPEPEQQAPAFSLPEYNAVDEMYRVLISALKAMDYKEYIKTDHWQHFRSEAVKHFNRTCQLCGANDTTLDVHHKTYVNRGRETFNDVILLCRHCHDLYHHNRDKCTCPRCSGEEGEHELTDHANLQ